MDSPDLQVKYQKLASEYSKLRAQNQVLKKAVIDEQGKNNQLKDNLKSCDQSSRKAEQEIDSLSFRNQQLTKRLSLLQDDLELLKSKPRKGQTKPDSQPANSILDNNVYAEELESKIKENARLHAEVSELEIFYKKTVSELELGLEEASREANRKNEDIKSQELILQNEIKKLENERVLQEVNAQQREAKIALMESQLKSLNGLDPSTKEEVEESKATAVPNHVRQRLPLTLPAPLRDRTKKVSDGKVIRDLLAPIQELSSGFVDFFASYSALLKQSSSLSSVHLKLWDQLTKEKGAWRLLSQRYEEMCAGVGVEESVRLESIAGLDAFSRAVANCAASLRKMLPVLSEKWLCFEEGQLDAPWRSTLGRLVSCWAALNPYLASLAAHSDGRTTLNACAIGKILSLLHERVTKLHVTSQELLTAWELLNVEDKTQEEATRRALSAIESALGKVCAVFSAKGVIPLSGGSSHSSSPSSGHSPGTPLIISPRPDGSGWSSAGTPDGIQLADSEASLAQQLAQATSRLSKLEEEREHWRLEHQLLSHRFDKETKKCQELKEELGVAKKCPKEAELRCGPASSSPPRENKEDREGVAVSSTSLIGEVVGSCCSSSEDREKEIRSHFTTRCSHLYMQLTSCTSQAALYQNECETLIRRLAVCEECRVIAEQEVEKQRREVAHIQETLSTTSRNYEEQISTMSDHLADLNEKITAQADSIEQLKFELKKKSRK